MDFEEDYRDELQVRFEALGEQHSCLDFEKIPENERLHPNYELCGLLKVYSLLKNKADFSLHSEHDILYICYGDIEMFHPLSDEDIIYMLRCGIRYEDEGLAMFN